MFTWYWFFLFYFIFCIHIKTLIHTIYVHRGLAHGHFIFSKGFSHVCRFCRWLYGSNFPGWMEFYAAQHRKHHRFSDSPNDPHSPHQFSLKQILDIGHNTPGRAYYISPEEVVHYAPDIHTPSDWIQRNIYDPHKNKGILILLLLALILFGPIAFMIAIPMLYFLPQLIIFISIYMFHKIGFSYNKNKDMDKSLNLLPWGIIFAGEELHSNHHSDPSNPCFSMRWWEVDIGWIYAKLFIFLGLMKLNSPKN